MTEKIEKIIIETVSEIKDDSYKNYTGMKTNLRQAVDYFQIAMFPSFAGRDLSICKACAENQNCMSKSSAQRRTDALRKAVECLTEALACVVSEEESKTLAIELVKRIPVIIDILKTDIKAAYEGDPAASSEDEIILSYPAFTAISIFRLAHELYLLKTPVVPRMMTEYAHEITGIDIHPGATIGKYFFIDHGTGVVIGETTTIGEHVKLYQHVTLGAKSFDSLPDGSLVKGIKRHPDIGNNVIIYAGATVLGGDTRIGDNCVIGGNVWLTHSVGSNQTVVR